MTFAQLLVLSWTFLGTLVVLQFIQFRVIQHLLKQSSELSNQILALSRHPAAENFASLKAAAETNGTSGSIAQQIEELQDRVFDERRMVQG
jgi:hypothetical protein